MDTSCTGCLQTAWLGIGEKPGVGVGVFAPHGPAGVPGRSGGQGEDGLYSCIVELA